MTICHTISVYNNRIKNGDYLEYPNELDVRVYHKLVIGQIINILLNDKALYLSEEIFSLIKSSSLKLFDMFEFENNAGEIRLSDDTASKGKINELLSVCFDDDFSKFIQEAFSQDIVFSGKLVKEIGSILGSISTAILMNVYGEDEFFRRLSEMLNSGERQVREIENKYDREYSGRGALIYNRVFRHKHSGNKNMGSPVVINKGEDLLDYKNDGLHCQAAVLHIGVVETGSSGTAFRISEDGYALTCAHVVENAKELTANAITGDGYLVDGFEDFGMYDVGFAEVVYINKQLDIALLKTEYCGSKYLAIEQGKLLPELGEEVVVLGYPLGYDMPQTNRFGPNISFYKGYVSSNQVKNGNSITFLDIDVKSGNSGSPVISTKTGKVIGIISGAKVGGNMLLKEKMPYMIPIQHFIELNK